MLQILRIPVTKVTPGVWKKHFKLTGTGKEESRLRALELYPELHDQLKLKKHHNRAEALLMARWYLEQ